MSERRRKPDDVAVPPDGAAGAGFVHRDPGSAAFWDERFDRDFLPWDLACVPEAFIAFAGALAPCPVLVPGCGSAYEAQWLARAGWPVRAIDFSASAVDAARRQLGEHAGVVEQADFFAYAPPWRPQWIYERAFLCALRPARWPDYAARMAALLPAGGVLAGCFVLGASTRRGPPFGIEREALEALLRPWFVLEEARPVADSLPVFEGRESWLTWRRNGRSTASFRI
ncbi:methyltransferase domain-containing protein [Burkholderia glumae]|uniref:Thiopurine S-methyltransferase n=1 Tax=Burkholderia glumae TaxID=337 RepID=A0AAP9Y1I9_BURGL|nr:Putative thiopurine S-methyltransferase [Burkholderia glumae BGR1]KHJ61139.1 thiopurine S-methyltransferase [Burkholderia glumae]NVE23510.1 thiopurine S-methyltransferase [Burkholderia glumae]PNL00448.1 thiopurine S-methyltransferase [Burkholderia glumae]QGA36636.1 thiopurine S-methyltransferase [Burkholderia glumae]